MADAPLDRDDAEFADEDNLDGISEFPPEEPLAVDERLTATEEQAGERFERRVAHREQHDEDRIELDRVGPLVSRGGFDVDDTDDDGDEAAWEMRSSDSTSWNALQDLEAPISAEEAAMHLTEDPPMDDDDGYVTD